MEKKSVLHRQEGSQAEHSSSHAEPSERKAEQDSNMKGKAGCPDTGTLTFSTSQ